MQAEIHPKYHETSVHCGCGNSFTTRSTREELKVDICQHVPSLLHGQAEIYRHRGPDREV